ncbi:hypothetical protein T11_3696 [Trichinella zimbabwensis]|uniref:Uncharacterized protein n=1 Tax=Trichinella zimbabwensis TaxID=268475 RepID=A0A0V1HNW8_9BILA|nr:hypothetical protein T11_3696 [Trichinella zimbabwensis]
MHPCQYITAVVSVVLPPDEQINNDSMMNSAETSPYSQDTELIQKRVETAERLRHASFVPKALICFCWIHSLLASVNSSAVSTVAAFLELLGEFALCRKRRHHAVTQINFSKLQYLSGLMTVATSCSSETVTKTAVSRLSLSCTSRLSILPSLPLSGHLSGGSSGQEPSSIKVAKHFDPNKEFCRTGTQMYAWISSNRRQLFGLDLLGMGIMTKTSVPF